MREARDIIRARRDPHIFLTEKSQPLECEIQMSNQEAIQTTSLAVATDATNAMVTVTTTRVVGNG